MKNIFRIFADDVKSIVRHFFATVIIIVIMVLPALYAWVNIYANSNPYVNTGNIKVALASNDPGVDLPDGTHVNKAEEVCDEMRESDSIGWQFPDTVDEAIEGVRSGEYYAAIIFEDNFTYNMYNFEEAISDENEALTYYTNAKKNAVASKITDTAASKLRESINTKYLETVFSVVFDETSDVADNVKDDSEVTVDSAIAQLQQIRSTLDSYEAAIGSFTANSAGVQKSIKGTKNKLALARKKGDSNVASAQEDIANAQRAVKSLNTALDARLNRIEESLKALEEADPITDQDKERAQERTDAVLRELEAMYALLPSETNESDLKTIIAALENMITTAQDVENKLEETPDDIQELLAAIDTLRVLRKDTLKPAADSLIRSLNSTLNMLGPFISTATGMLDDVDPVPDAAGDTVGSLDDSMLRLQNTFGSASDRIGDIIAQVEAAEEDEKLQVLVDLLNGDSELYGKFFSALVDVESEQIYSVASYGAAMTPFYTILAIWVGGVFLVSILKTGVNKEKFPDLKEQEYFFGRFLLFFLIGQAQAAVTVAGDIYLLDCQPAHPGHMFFAGAVASLVFMLLIYALTLSFGDIGKAIVVVVMVVQIAGSSGSYPIEILPEIFAKMYRFFPFPYGINAMREAICGMYGNDYYVYLGELLVFGVLGIVIGLLVRRPFIGMSEFVSEKLEETEVL